MSKNRERENAGYLLIVDDEPEIVTTIRRLARVPWPSRSAGTAAAAAALIQAQPRIVAAIVDVHLPDGSGLELIPHIRAGSPGCPVLVLTAYCEPINANAAHTLGAEFAAKPSFAENVRAFAARLVNPRSSPTVSQIVEGFARQYGLTAKEQQVLELFAVDSSRDEVAESLGGEPQYGAQPRAFGTYEVARVEHRGPCTQATPNELDDAKRLVRTPCAVCVG